MQGEFLFAQLSLTSINQRQTTLFAEIIKPINIHKKSFHFAVRVKVFDIKECLSNTQTTSFKFARSRDLSSPTLYVHSQNLHKIILLGQEYESGHYKM